MTDQDRKEYIRKTVEFVKELPKIKFSKEEIDFCKVIQNDRIDAKNSFDKKHSEKIRINKKISRWHSDEELYFGLLCELSICKYFDLIYTEKGLLKKWAKDQIKQNDVLRTQGRFDCKDVGLTQIRAAEYSETSLRRVIYRQNDFRTKAYQPVIGCLFNSKENDIWTVICGYITYEDLVKRKMEFWDDPDKNGFSAMFIPMWELTPIKNFDVNYL